MKSVWNTCGWTPQEYPASKIAHFYTEDWTLYLNLQVPNHKKSPGVISEMEEATGVSAQQLMALRSAFGRSYITLRPGRRRRWKMLHVHCWVFSQLLVYHHCTVKGGVRWDIYWHMSLPDLELWEIKRRLTFSVSSIARSDCRKRARTKALLASA